MPLSDFKLEQLSFQISYETAFYLWGRAGEVWGQMRRSYPEVKPTSGTPTKVVATNGNNELGVELDKAYVIAHHPASASTFAASLDEFVAIVTRVLEIETLTRVGLRVIYSRKMATLAAAADVALSLGIMSEPKELRFGFDGAVTGTDWMLEWTGNAIGANVRIRTDRRQFQMTPSPGVTEVTAMDVKTDRLLADVDYFTTAPMELGQLRPSLWTTEAAQLVRRNLTKLLEIK